MNIPPVCPVVAAARLAAVARHVCRRGSALSGAGTGGCNWLIEDYVNEERTWGLCDPNLKRVGFYSPVTLLPCRPHLNIDSRKQRGEQSAPFRSRTAVVQRRPEQRHQLLLFRLSPLCPTKCFSRGRSHPDVKSGGQLEVFLLEVLCIVNQTLLVSSLESSQIRSVRLPWFLCWFLLFCWFRILPLCSVCVLCCSLTASRWRRCGRWLMSAGRQTAPGFRKVRQPADLWSLLSDVTLLTRELMRGVLSGRCPSSVEAVGGSSAPTVTSARDNQAQSRAAGSAAPAANRKQRAAATLRSLIDFLLSSQGLCDILEAAAAGRVARTQTVAARSAAPLRQEATRRHRRDPTTRVTGFPTAH